MKDIPGNNFAKLSELMSDLNFRLNEFRGNENSVFTLKYSFRGREDQMVIDAIFDQSTNWVLISEREVKDKVSSGSTRYAGIVESEEDLTRIVTLICQP